MSKTFVIVELIGHKRIAGRLITEPPFAPELLWLDVFRPDGTYISQGIGRSAIYRATPATEAAARAASDFDPPLHAFELERKEERALGRAVTALRAVEWGGWDSEAEECCCPECRAPESENRHADNCPVGAVLDDDEITF